MRSHEFSPIIATKSHIHEQMYNTRHWKVMWAMHGPRWLPMASDSPIGGHEAREPCDHPRAMEGHRRPSGAIHGSHYFQCRIGIVFIVRSCIYCEYGILFQLGSSSWEFRHKINRIFCRWNYSTKPILVNL